jgi:hypothetical protein
MKGKGKIKIWAAGAALLLCANCVSLVEKTGRAIDGTAFADKEISRYGTSKKEAKAGLTISEVTNKAQERSIIIELDEFPEIKLRATSPGQDGEFFLTTLDYLGGSLHGWNEYRLILTGGGNLRLDGKNAEISIPGGIEGVQITWGRIQRYDNRITGDQALSALRNRRERIQALTEWMAGLENAPRGLNLKKFEKHWKPCLFPELASGKSRPAGWMQKDDAFVRSDFIPWNTDYTGRIFPENLRRVRDTGTLLRDWEEALAWIYIEYEWENIVNLFSTAITLQRIK